MQVNEENAKIWHRLLKDWRSYYVAKLMFTVEEIPVTVTSNTTSFPEGCTTDLTFEPDSRHHEVTFKL